MRMMAALACSTMGIRARVKPDKSRIQVSYANMHASSAVDWAGVDTVLLDMDGTLLDLRFDNWFWQIFVPSRYAAAHGISEAEAQRRLTPKFVDVAHTLQWYCIDYWTRELELDIPALKRET